MNDNQTHLSDALDYQTACMLMDKLQDQQSKQKSNLV